MKPNPLQNEQDAKNLLKEIDLLTLRSAIVPRRMKLPDSASVQLAFRVAPTEAEA